MVRQGSQAVGAEGKDVGTDFGVTQGFLEEGRFKHRELFSKEK